MKLTYVEVTDAIGIPGANGARVKSLRGEPTAGGGDWFTLAFDEAFVMARYKGDGPIIIIPVANVKQMYAEPDAPVLKVAAK